MKNKKILFIIILLGTIILGTILFNPKPAYAAYKPFGGWILATIPIPYSVPPTYIIVIGPPRGGAFYFVVGASQSLSGRIPPVPGFPTLGISIGSTILYLW